MTALTFQKPQILKSCWSGWNGGCLEGDQAAVAWKTHADEHIKHMHTHVIMSKSLEADHTLKLTYAPFNQC